MFKSGMNCLTVWKMDNISAMTGCFKKYEIWNVKKQLLQNLFYVKFWLFVVVVVVASLVLHEWFSFFVTFVIIEIQSRRYDLEHDCPLVTLPYKLLTVNYFVTQTLRLVAVNMFPFKLEKIIDYDDRL